MDAAASAMRVSADRRRAGRHAARRPVHRRLRRRLPRAGRGALHGRTHPLRGKQAAVTRELPLHYWSVARLRAAYASGEASPAEAARACLERIARFGPALGAFLTDSEEHTA